MNVKDAYVWTPLHWAAVNNHVEVVQALHTAGETCLFALSSFVCVMH